jgi:uncharacterized protein
MIHFYKLNGYNIALDSPSGAVHVLTDIAHDLLSRLNPPLGDSCPADILAGFDDREATAEAYGDLYELYRAGMLFSEDWDAETVHPTGLIKSLCLNVSHDCNMRCRYCFAETGSFSRGRSLMSFETGKRALDFLFEKSGPRKNLEVDFFGGEPLMNFDVVKRLVEYGRKTERALGKNIRFTITTNGSLLDDDSIAFINAHMSNAVLSIDGCRETNDKMRTFEDGSGTYDDILPKYKRLTAGRSADYYVRGTFTRENLNFCDDVLHLADLGFDQISVEPVVLGADSKLSLRAEDLPVIFAEYEKLAAAMIEREREGRGFNFFHFMIDLDAGPCVYKRVKGCGSGSEYAAVTPDGDIYPCHQFVSFPRYRMGNLYDGSFDTDMQKRFAGCNITTNPECRACWAKYYCGGGCAANNLSQCGDPVKPYGIACELERKRVECALMIKAALADDE